MGEEERKERWEREGGERDGRGREKREVGGRGRGKREGGGGEEGRDEKVCIALHTLKTVLYIHV